ENAAPYKVGAHQHAPEIAQALGFPVTFVPHLLPVRRGLIATCYVRSTGPDLRELLEEHYADSHVVTVLPEGAVPELARVQATDGAEIGVFGGSGFYRFLPQVREVKVDTPYGPPSDSIALATVGGRRVAFLPRHGKEHQLPPHRVPYRANLWAMKQLGVKRIIGPCAAGSLQPHIKPGDFVVCDQFVDRTSGRADTFYDGPITTHLPMAQPYCPELRALAVEQARALGITVHDRGTVVVIQGPRFSTTAESRWFSGQGWEVVNMTQYPECVLAREQEICYVNVSLITDYDVGLVGREDVKPVTHEEVLRVFQANIERLRELLVKLIAAIPEKRSCGCGDVLRVSRIS
ncbi:MAG: S-methyl-5'-thioadenosine phosphorylase, partial [Acetobacteraceae bacterium]|nr:S-methyl-5'-thioadenosine phosphorylase [Acetobacteraceae bacterium]